MNAQTSQQVTVRPLETEFHSGGFLYRQLARERQWAVYAQSKGGRITSYELVHIQQAPPKTIFGRDYPEREVYPSPSEWGTEAWTISNREEAIERLHRMAEFALA